MKIWVSISDADAQNVSGSSAWLSGRTLHGFAGCLPSGLAGFVAKAVSSLDP